MNRTRFQTQMEITFDRLRKLNSTKGHDYAGDEDALSNFKRDTERLQKIAVRDPVLAKWYIYFSKHYDALMTFLEEGAVASEPIEGRIDDLHLYLHLLTGMIIEQEDQAAHDAGIPTIEELHTMSKPCYADTHCGRVIEHSSSAEPGDAIPF